MPEVAGAALRCVALPLLLLAPFARGLLSVRAALAPDLAPQFQTPTDVGNVSAADCMRARKRDPTIVCGNMSAVDYFFRQGFEGPISPVNYPHYTDPLCHSEGGFLCDPSTDARSVGPSVARAVEVVEDLLLGASGATAMTGEQHQSLSQRLVALRNQDENLVVCGRLQHDPVDSWHYQPFYLGIAVLPAWPAQSSHVDTLQRMGEMIMADWNMGELYVGEPQPYLRCPTTALLLLSPSSGEAFLSSPSCEFICDSNGGGEVAARARAALRGEGPEDQRVYSAAAAGAEEVYRQLAARHFNSSAPSAPPVAHEELNISNLLQRVIFGLVVVALVAAGLLGVLVLLLGPGIIARRGKLEC